MSIQDLRKRTQAGFLDCKKALDESNGDIEKAIQILRQKGLTKAIKRAGFEATEGAVVICNTNDVFGMLLFGTETDFVAKNDDFCKFIEDELYAFLNSDLDDINNLIINEETFSQRLAGLVGKIGENIVLRDQIKIMQQGGSKISYYLHNKINENFHNIGKIGVLLKTNDIEPEKAKHLCMHIASFKPLVLNQDQLTDEIKSTLGEDKKDKDIVLMMQSYLVDPSHTVSSFCKASGIDIIEFKVFSVK